MAKDNKVLTSEDINDPVPVIPPEAEVLPVPVESETSPVTKTPKVEFTGVDYPKKHG
jgi:hypothetical protein